MKGTLQKIILGITAIISFCNLHAQAFPSAVEAIPWLVTFGKSAPTSWGDDDFTMSYFFSIPQKQKEPFYIRVFDPDCGGANDEMKGAFDTKTKFSLYGGKGAITTDAAKDPDPIPGFDSGTLMFTKTFGVDDKYDNEYYTFGPISPNEGELAPEYGGYIFKLITQGISGDDGNVFRYFLSSQPTKNVPLEEGNAFTFEYSIRMPDNNAICHIYPFVDNNVISVKQFNFDWDGDGIIRIVSPAKRGELVKLSNEDNWANSTHPITDEEKNGSLDVQFVKTKGIKNNNVVLRVTNQYDKALPFYASPIGGVPKYKFQIKVKYQNP